MSRPRIGWSVLVASALAVLVAIAFAEDWIEVPDRWNPFAPLRPQERAAAAGRTPSASALCRNA